MEIPSTLQPALHIIGGALVFALGASFAWKCFQAAFNGKTEFWSGLEHYGMLFVPITMLTPLFCHLPHGPKSLIKTKQESYIHLLYGPVFFLLSLMCLTAGADQMGLPGSASMNMVLTCGRHDVPPAITYSPPFTYRFPILKKARKTIVRTLTTRIETDKSKSLNAFEKAGVDVEKQSLGGGGAAADDDD